MQAGGLRYHSALPTPNATREPQRRGAPRNSRPSCERVDRYARVYTLPHMTPTDRDRLLKLARERGIISAAEVREAGIHSQQLTRLVEAGLLQRTARGQYRFADAPLSEHHGVVLASRAVPRGVICLLSALELHGIGTQLPPEIWIAVERRERTPSVRGIPLRVVRFSGAAFTEGVQTQKIEGRKVRVYGVAKTLADLFKYRNKIGLDVALEALREAWRDRRFTMDELDRAARVCRVDTVMRPYVETVVA